MTAHAPQLLAATLAVLVSMGWLGAIAWREAGKTSRVEARLRLIRQSGDAAASQADTSAAPHWLVALVGSFGRALAGSGVLPAKTLAELQASLNAAGLRGGGGIGVFVGSKALLLAGLAALGGGLARQLATSTLTSIALPLGGAMMGMLLPDFYLRRRRASHLKQVQAGLPDALDMLVICTEAGLGLEAGIDRVATEIRPAHPAIAEELHITCTELRIIADRRQVLLDMGTRTGLDSVRQLAATLIQTTQFGTPLSHALRVLAGEMRTQALTRFEARAARLPVLLTVPMIVFILPCIFIIVGGPAALQLTSALGKK